MRSLNEFEVIPNGYHFVERKGRTTSGSIIVLKDPLFGTTLSEQDSNHMNCRRSVPLNTVCEIGQEHISSSYNGRNYTSYFVNVRPSLVKNC